HQLAAADGTVRADARHLLDAGDFEVPGLGMSGPQVGAQGKQAAQGEAPLGGGPQKRAAIESVRGAGHVLPLAAEMSLRGRNVKSNPLSNGSQWLVGTLEIPKILLFRRRILRYDTCALPLPPPNAPLGDLHADTACCQASIVAP